MTKKNLKKKPEPISEQRRQCEELRSAWFSLGRKGWFLPDDYNGEHPEISKGFPFPMSHRAAYAALQAMRDARPKEKPIKITYHQDALRIRNAFIGALETKIRELVVQTAVIDKDFHIPGWRMISAIEKIMEEISKTDIKVDFEELLKSIRQVGMS